MLPVFTALVLFASNEIVQRTCRGDITICRSFWIHGGKEIGEREALQYLKKGIERFIYICSHSCLMKQFFIAILCCIISLVSNAQLYGSKDFKPSRKDSLRGGERIERSCYDVHYYDLWVDLDFQTQSILGKNEIFFELREKSSRIQVDLFENMILDSIVMNGAKLNYTRDFDAVFISLPLETPLGNHSLLVYYNGKPQIARMPPWDGGFTWAKDKDGQPWLGVSCQGTGASLWWPTKEVYSDEPDSMRIHCTVPSDLYAVCNGVEEAKTISQENRTTYNWKVSYPINNYNVTLNVAKYVHFDDLYITADGDSLALDYYVLPSSLAEAKKQFEQVKPMLKCYEEYLGPYPFIRDGFALVETPYLGMEHQGAIAYGNKYKNGYLGMDRSGQSLQFDYIIIHETGHEWWGNSVSAQDLADMWIHESFCTYSEAIYVECRWDYESALKYVNALKFSVENSAPIIGIYGFNKEGHSDMYVKGMLFLNTLRHVINNDEQWWAMIKNMADKEFKIRTTNYDEVVAYFSREAKMDLGPFFKHYVKKAQLPELNYSIKKKSKGYVMTVCWAKTDADFKMPIEYMDGGERKRIVVTKSPQQIRVASSEVEFDLDRFYYSLKKK